MDTVYGTKKYFQSLSGGSDIYRSQACRSMVNDYSYQNTIGRRSTLGPYYHMNKQPAYTNELNLNSQYSYNAWGMWRDNRNFAPSTFSAKTHHTHYQKSRSFSIILITAAFIVLLAVISIAGLALYFSSKTNAEDPVLGFEGSFRIAKGDLFSTGLKYNHTTTYKQKIEFYKRFVERALTDNSLSPLRIDIWGFGDGPLIKVSFRVFLDVRKLPQNIHSVEEYIKESLFLETTALKSLYRSLRIDAESVEIKRIMDEQVVKSASLFREVQSVPTSQTLLEKRLMKKGNSPSTLQKAPTTVRPRTTIRPHSADEEPDVDLENAPVIQGSFEGSFEITKTDADIARKKVVPTKAYSNVPAKAVTPFALRVKPKKPGIEKLTTIVPHQQINNTVKPAKNNDLITTTTTTTKKTTTTPLTTTTTTTTTTTKKPSTSTSTFRTPTTTTTKTTKVPPTIAIAPQFVTRLTTTQVPNRLTYPTLTTKSAITTLPKLDSNLFTSIPILDTQPWKPIHRQVPELVPGPPPAFPTKSIAQKIPIPNNIPERRIDEIELPFFPEVPLGTTQIPISPDSYAPKYFNIGSHKMGPEESIPVKNQEKIFYHSFGNPVFVPGVDDIERLGTGASVKPHPLPVPLIDDVVIPPFRPLDPTLAANEKLPLNIESVDVKFEHIGGGVIVKKNNTKDTDHSTTSSTTSTISPPPASTMIVNTSSLKIEIQGDNGVTTTESPPVSNKNNLEQLPPANVNSGLADTIGEFFMDLLHLPKEEQPIEDDEPLEARIDADESTEGIQKTSEAQIESSSSEIISNTTKPNFMNLKEIILNRNKTNPTKMPQTTTTLQPLITTTVEPSTTTKRSWVRPLVNKKPPTILDDSNLFPSQSKWEFLNSSSSGGFGHASNMRKVFNKTLQAWVSEDIDKSNTEHFTLDDIKTRINNATNIQDISLIFDTLASKLGITPSVPAKVPPFSHNKIKHSYRNDSKIKSSTLPSISSLQLTSTTEIPTTTRFVELPIQQREPFIRPMASFMEDISSSSSEGIAIPVVGEAEVEVVDPNQYDQILQSSQVVESSTAALIPELVTLLPVRSNSGIRFHRPLDDIGQPGRNGDSSVEKINHANIGNGRLILKNDEIASDTVQSRLFPPAETIVKGGVSVEVK